MVRELFENAEKGEKKVEYIELIYDLIFVYIIGRNNSLLHTITNGFVDAGTVMTYILCTLAVIQIWYYSTYYINIYGRHSVRDHVFLFINMFMMYFLAEGTRQHWQSFHLQYHLAWALILVNIALQYVIEYRQHEGEPMHRMRIRGMAVILFAEAALVFGAAAEYRITGTTVLSPAAIILGMAAMTILSKKSCSGAVDFAHLSERAMLYVVFTFGEMIIAIAAFFEGDFTISSLYYSIMGFLIVVGLFLSYGIVYDHIVDRELRTNGMSYMFMHIFIIFGLNIITSSLEFMKEDEIELLPKIIMLIISFIVYYVFLLIMSKTYAKKSCRIRGRYYLRIALLLIGFAVMMLLFRNNSVVNIALTVAFVFAILFTLYKYRKKIEENMNKPFCEI